MQKIGDNKVEMIKSTPVYLCDPEKNLNCKKNACGIECFRTLKKECSLYGEPFQFVNMRQVIDRGI